MPRRPKQGIEFAGWSVDIFDGDTKIDKLLDAQGWVGFGIYFYLCQMAYKFDGYFYRWAYDDSASTARRMGGGVGSKTVEETVRYCLQIGLFDKGLFDRVGILTSKGIQRRFLAAIQGRRVKSVIDDYWLLDDSESEGLVKCAKNDCLQATNAYLQYANSDLQQTYIPKSRVEDSKVKESRGEEETAVGVFLNRVNPNASPLSLQKLQAYERNLGTDICIRAIYIAIDDKIPKWSYIEGILQKWSQAGVKCIADIDHIEERHQIEKLVKGKIKPGAGGTAPQPVKPGEADKRAKDDMDRLRKYMKEGY